MARRRRYSSYNSGSEYARRHVEEAERFSKEIGGTDEDVKKYFFSLQKSDLDSILQEYGRNYGGQAETYARATISKWRSGQRRMSGLVAKRLFSLLPPRMPTKTKFQLAENIWNHFGPSSNTSFRIGPNTPVEQVTEYVLRNLDGVVTEYSIPQNVKNRFEWLAAGDVELKEKLLNHFRQIEKVLASQKTISEIPILQRQVRDHSDATGLAKSVIQIHKHQVSVFVLPDLEDQIVEGPPPAPSSSGGMGWLIAIGIAIVLILIYANR